MPNWCYTNITIYHNDEEKLKAFFNKIEEWRKKPFKENDFDTYTLGWLGNIVGNSGLAEWKTRENGREDFVPNIACRGSLQTFELDGNRINISTETAWCPMLNMWQRLCDKFLPDAEIWYTAEESGCGLFWTNDPGIVGKYYIDLWDVPDEFAEETPDYEATEDYTIKFLQRVLKTSETDIKKLLSMASDVEEQWFAINEWTSHEISECD